MPALSHQETRRNNGVPGVLTSSTPARAGLLGTERAHSQRTVTHGSTIARCGSPPALD